MRRAMTASALAMSIALVIACSGAADEGAGAVDASAVDASAVDASESDGGRGDAGADARVPVGPPAIRFGGRFDARDPAGPKAAWPGSRIIIRFEGTSLSARLGDELANDKPGPSEWDVVVDGKAQPRLVLARGAFDYDLATDLAAGEHVIELSKRSESQLGVTQLLGVDYHGGKLLAPIPLPDRRIEIIGDSSATGFGVDGAGPTCPDANDAAKWENFGESWGARLGVTFGADVHGTSYSGKGLVKNIWRPDTETMPKLFTRANPEDDSSTFDLSTWLPDVVVIMMGGNDFDVGLPTDDGPATLDDFTGAYDAFVGTVRGAYPAAHVFLTVSATLSDDQPAGRQSRTNVKAAITQVLANRAADARLHASEPSVATPTEVTGCDGHGGPGFHDRVAGELAAAIKPLLGW